MERKRPASEKQNSSKKKIQETSRRTRSSKGNTYKRINYCEDSSSDEDVMSRTHLSSSATVGVNRQKESPSSQSTLLSKIKTEIFYKKLHESKGISSDDLDIDADGSHTKDYIPDADEFLQEPSNCSILQDRPDPSVSKNSLPFRFWGQNYDTKKYSKGNKLDKVDSEFEDFASARKVPNLLIKDNVHKEWEKHKALMLNYGKKMESRLKDENADTFPRSSSSFDQENKLGNYEALNKLANKKPSRSKIGDAETRSSPFCDKRNDMLKSIKPVMNYEGNMEHKKDSTEVMDHAYAQLLQ